LRTAGYLYVDKTEYIWHLIDPPGESYFLSRPRRFGKSLLVSTLKAVFQGKRELFQGLAIYDKPYDWKQYPVIHLDMANCDAHTESALRDYLARMLERQAKQHNVEVDVQRCQLASSFSELIEKVAGESQAAILLDEYDKPILGNIANHEVKAIRDTLADFYSPLKTEMDYERFVLVTGVSKFSHVSLFSKLNNLTDITLDPKYAGMLGFTEAEIRQYFAEVIPAAAKENGYSEENLMTTLLKWYDGYRFSGNETHVCNPVSIVKFFNNSYRFSNYWDSTGTPSFLLNLMRKREYDLEATLRKWHDERIFAAYELDKLDITGLLWQTGYLTIKEILPDDYGLKYRLDFPDMEVQQTFMDRLLEMYSGDQIQDGLVLVSDFRQALRRDDLDGFLTMFQSLLAGISYELHIKAEKYYQSIFFVIFKLMGAAIEAESRTSLGRVDAYVRTEKTVYIFEFKLNRTADEAVGQIIDRHYYEKFRLCGLPVRLVGVNFDYSRRNITGWKELPTPE
ncbi:MAG: AAA family ATPase, partial [Victivallales bacterium]|nr:AAA family ATPase [Victivallales bacterium]